MKEEGRTALLMGKVIWAANCLSLGDAGVSGETQPERLWPDDVRGITGRVPSDQH